MRVELADGLVESGHHHAVDGLVLDVGEVHRGLVGVTYTKLHIQNVRGVGIDIIMLVRELCVVQVLVGAAIRIFSGGDGQQRCT